jgi:hypothetical protein
MRSQDEARDVLRSCGGEGEDTLQATRRRSRERSSNR